MAAEVTERLAACADAIAVVAELRSILFDLAGTQARQAALDEAVVFLTASEERWTLATETLISDLSGNLSERDVQLELLDALLVWATREPAEKNQTVLEILLQFFELALTSLGDNEGGKRWLKWGDQVLAVVHQNAALIEKQESLGSGEEIGEESEGWRSYVVNIAVLLLQLRNKLEGDDDATPDLKTVTFVWKVMAVETNLAKLATAFGPILASSGPVSGDSGETAVLVTSKPGQELRGMLDQALEITEKLADEAVNDQAKESIRTLLWYPAADMVRAVGQRQPSEITNVDVENSIQWGHLLVLTAFAGLSGCSSSNAKVPYDDSVRAVEVSQLFARYRECALSDAVSRSVEATKLFTDLVLEFLIGFESTVELQLALLKQTLYPDWTQRTLCWEIWRELLCFSWDETLAMQTLQLLIDVTQWDDVDSDKSFVLARGMEDEILQLIAFVYADLPLSLKDVCMDQVTAIIDVISSEGPGHQFNLRVASQLHLLEKLVAVQFLKEYNGPMKDEWIAKYLPMCFECCGTVLELLSAEAKAPTIKRENILGMMRVLDMCLMVLRGVFDDNEPKQDDIAELSIILVRIKRTSRSVKLEKAGSRCIGRAIETSLYLLSKLGPVLKANRNNQCVQVMKDLLTILDDTKNSSQAGAMNDTLIVTARFVGDSLFDMQVASGDIPVVWQLLLFLFQKLFAATRAADRQAPQLSLLLSVCLDALGQFPDESAELYAEPDQSSQDTSNKRSADDLPGTLPQKRHKLTHFVSLCREIESSLSSIESDEAAVNILSGKELEDATAVLHKLLTNIITLC
ncbi:hypothetical protein JG687_00000906 [Phytophthora cactorum]|uniref:Uncharacterized protein n=1 Tax=Phytophthora cactorum TaxID=29920 RepID=A0A8T1V2E3_9STRA|nr:hypothetical protein JG687_00000906 [Phytophthora cactorum]